MASKYTAPNDYRAFCEMLGETETSMAHHGVKGQKWGVRKYQNMDGSLTEAGRKHYGYGAAKKKHGDTGENEVAADESSKKIAQITKSYEFNKEYTLRDPLVKQAILIAKQWDAERSNELHSNEDINRKESLKTIGKGAAIGAAIGAGRGIGIAGLSISSENSLIDEYNRSAQRMRTFSLNDLGTATIIGPAANRLTADEKAGRIAAFGTIGALSGAATGAAVGGIIHGSRAIKAKHANENLNRTINEIAANPNVDKKTGLKLKNGQTSADDDMAKVNPGYKNWSDGTKSNCAICTATYALRRKGYDVTANGANDGYDTTAFLQAFPKASMRKVKLSNNSDELRSSLNIPEGGYGNLSVNWKNGGGHSMVVSVEGGRVVIRDTQSNKVYRGSAVNKILSKTDGEGKIIRLDNANPDIAQMKKMGMINPLGQSFKVNQIAVTQGVSGIAKKGGKHGDT